MIPDAEERRMRSRWRHRRSPPRDPADPFESAGDRLADHVAAVGGSWGFISVFSVVLLSWMLLNSEVLQHWGLAFDPYPYVFLNLMLSTLASVQAPIIMMSQNRQSRKDRLAASLDYEVNLRCELEMARLHDKIDSAVAARLEEILSLMRPSAANRESGD